MYILITQCKLKTKADLFLCDLLTKILASSEASCTPNRMGAFWLQAKILPWLDCKDEVHGSWSDGVIFNACQ